MKWELDDNSRNGFQYLLFGALVIALVVVVNAMLDRAITPIGPDGAFGHGYLISDDGSQLIVARSTRGERMATAVLLAFLLALFAGALVALVARALGATPKRWALPMARLAFVLSAAYLLYAALFLPPRATIGQRDNMLIIWERDVLLNDLPWPREKRIELVGFDRITGITTEAMLTREMIEHRVKADLLDGRSIILGNSRPVPAADTAASMFAHERSTVIRGWLNGQ